MAYDDQQKFKNIDSKPDLDEVEVTLPNTKGALLNNMKQ